MINRFCKQITPIRISWFPVPLPRTLIYMLFFLSIIQLPGRWNGRVLPQSPGSRQRFWVLDLVGAFPPCVCVLIRGLWVKIYTLFFFWDGVWWIFPTAGGNQWHHGQSRFHVCSNKLQQCLRKNPIHEDVSWPH